MAVIVSAVEPGTAAALWPRVGHMVDAGYAAGGDFVPADIIDRVESGRMLLWIAIDDENGEIYVAVTTELIPMRAGLVCWIGQCGGSKMDLWIRFIAQIEEYARNEGCVKTILRGRPGWQRVLADGYKVRTVQLEKML